MNKLIILIWTFVLSFLFLSCIKSGGSLIDVSHIKTVNGCEYFIDANGISHSGTCPNPIHPENWTKEMWREKLQLDKR
jgi:hypothetical protein